MPESNNLLLELETARELRNYHHWIFDEIKPFLGKRLAEIGGGIGTFTEIVSSGHLAKNSDASLEVFEPSNHLSRQLVKSVGSRHRDLMEAGRLCVIPGYFEPKPDKFDTVIMINVLEHIDDDDQIVRTIYESLCPGGILVIFVPALRWLYSPLDKSVGHHRRYEKTSLQQLCNRHRFQTLKSKYMDLVGILPWFLLNVVGGLQSVNPRLTRWYDKFIVPTTRRIENLGFNFLGKNILMIVKKDEQSNLLP